LGDAENHHGHAVHDADDDPCGPDVPIGEVSPIIGDAPGPTSRLHLHKGPHALRVDVRETGAIYGSLPAGADTSHGAESLSAKVDSVTGGVAGTRIWPMRAPDLARVSIIDLGVWRRLAVWPSGGVLVRGRSTRPAPASPATVVSCLRSGAGPDGQPGRGLETSIGS
jgi:hypothetical protein